MTKKVLSGIYYVFVMCVSVYSIEELVMEIYSEIAYQMEDFERGFFETINWIIRHDGDDLVVLLTAIYALLFVTAIYGKKVIDLVRKEKKGES
jgi:hypothetical protein